MPLGYGGGGAGSLPLSSRSACLQRSPLLRGKGREGTKGRRRGNGHMQCAYWVLPTLRPALGDPPRMALLICSFRLCFKSIAYNSLLNFIILLCIFRNAD